jgi:ABC-type bacteriocin/lantibiotic exporter with double-glycine peptidase domain
MTPIKRFIGLLAKDKRDLVYLYLYAVINGIINLSLPVGIQAIMGLVLAGRLSSSWVILTVIVTLGITLAGVFQIMQMYIVEILQRRLFARAAFEFAYRIPKFELLKMKNYYPPELVNRFFDTVGVQKTMPKILIDFSTSALQIFFGLILLSLYHPIFIAFGITLIAIILIVVYLTSRRGLETSLAESNFKYEMAFWLTEIARAVKTFKISGNSRLNLSKTDRIVNQYLGARKSHFRILIRQFASIVGLKTLVTAALLIIGAILLIENQITIGQFVASEIIIILVLNSAEKLITSMESIYDVLTSLEKIGKVTDMPIEEENASFQHLDHEGALSLRTNGLNVIGTMEQTPIITDLDLDIKAGERVCVTGRNGSGKSSLLKVLSTSLDNYSGSIFYNDIPFKNISKEDFRQNIGVIFDDQEIFFGTLHENITLGRDHITSQEVINIVKDVGLEDLVSHFKDGYNQQIIYPERMFSGTDRVRLLVARALVGKPKMIFSEDLFSNLELDCKNKMLDMLFNHCQTHQITMMIVSNNPEIQAKCDKLINL